MCLILIAHQVHADWPLVIAANRDEFRNRPSVAADWWPQAPVLGGRDLRAGGTWLAVNRAGRFCAVTNYREMVPADSARRSRGEVPLRFLEGRTPTTDFGAQLQSDATLYGGYSALFGGPGDLHWYSNRGGAPQRVTPGVHGLSNHLLDTPWAKVERGRKMLEENIKHSLDIIDLMRILSDKEVPDDALLPNSGLGAETERMLAPIFIDATQYGTRCSTVVAWSETGEVHFAESSHDPGGGLRRFSFQAAVDAGIDAGHSITKS